MRSLPLTLLLVASVLPACRGCGGGSSEEGEGKAGSTAFDAGFVSACRKQGTEEYCACALKEIKARVDAARIDEVSAALDRGELPPSEFADAADACGADGDSLRVGKPFKGEVVDAVMKGCAPNNGEPACECALSSLQARYAFVQVASDLQVVARGQPAFGPVAEALSACQRDALGQPGGGR